MLTSKGALTSKQKHVMKDIENFYSNLYAENEEEVNVNHLFFQSFGIPNSPPIWRVNCKGKLTVKECFDCLQSFENNKCPGEDGLTAEVYKTKHIREF